MAYRYSVFGLEVESELACVELLEGSGAPDVTIRFGVVPDSLSRVQAKGLRYQANDRELLLTVDDVARFWVREGNCITIDRFADADDDSIRLFLLGSALGALLKQRSLLLLHASVIETGSGAVAFMGPSGVGKSTLVSLFSKKGYRVLSDDLCVLESDAEGNFWVLPGYPQVKLWEDALDYFELNKNRLRKIRPELCKHALPLLSQFCTTKTKLFRLYSLNVSNENDIQIAKVIGPESFELVRKNTYRQQFLSGLGLKESHFKQCFSLVSRIEIKRIIRPASGYQLEELALAVEKDLGI